MTKRITRWALAVLNQYLDALKELEHLGASNYRGDFALYEEALANTNRELEIVRMILADVLPDVEYEEHLSLTARSMSGIGR